ncbi:MAG: site-specific integrase, partial [Muribaculaceae bacterium]
DIGKYGIAEAYKSTFNSIKRFLAGRTVTFDHIDVKFLRDYEHYLISTCVVQNTISYYMRNLRTIYNRAFNDNLILQDHNPFLKYKFHKVTTIKRALKKEVIQRIVNLDLSNNKELEEARDFFMFSFYTRGMSAVDILYLKHSDIVDGVVFYQRHKTQQGLQIAVTDQIQHLLDKYNVDKEYALPFITRYRRPILRDQYKAAYTRLNRHLKKVAVLAGINSPLTSYVARHSWATIAKEGGAPIAAISEGLGHTSEKTTSIYLSYFDRSVIDNINKNVGLFKNNC